MMEQYPTYKPSGVEWIGEIPEHWEKTRLRNLGEFYGGLSGKSGEDFKQENNPNNKPYIPYTNIFRNTYISKDHFDYVVMEENENQNRVQKFDMFFLMSSETHEDLGKSCILIEDVEELYLNSFCKGFRINREEIYPLFLNYLLLGQVFKELISVEGRGFTRINLRQDRLKDTPVLLPPLSEQEQIVQYLDEKTEEIDRLVSLTQKKIELLKEKRTSLINHVVTKGLDTNVKLKPSGVEWIGDIPEHWVMTPLKRIVVIGNGKDFKDIELEEGGYPVLGTGGVFSRCSDYLHTGPSVLLGRKGTIDNPLFIDEPFWTSDTIYYTVIDENKVRPTYLFHSVRQIPFGLYSYGLIPSMTKTDYEEISFPIPPLSEQEQIVQYIDEKTEEIDRLVSIEEKRIDTLKEYRQSLISEVVTGKIKVSNNNN